MKRKILIYFSFGLVGLFILFLIFLSARESTPQFKPPVPRILNSKIITGLINDYRVKNGLRPLIEDEKLCNLAKDRLPEIKRDQSHAGFELRVKNNSFGFTYDKLAENLISARGLEIEVFRAWVDSEEHRENILTPFQFTCLKCDLASCVQLFANF